MFVVDEMLGHVAKWLRIAGYDTTFAYGLPDAEVLRVAGEDGRILVTADRELVLRARRVGIRSVLVTEDDPSDALSQIVMCLHLDFKPKMARCSVCNGKLKSWKGGPIESPYVVPKHVKDLWICEGCGKVYWRGTHWKNISKFLKQVSERALDL